MAYWDYFDPFFCAQMAMYKKKFLPKSITLSRTRTPTCTYYFRRCSKWRFPKSIPDELLFEILVRLPAEDIYFGARFVCRRWYNMTHTKNFIHKHLERASHGLLYMDKEMNLSFTTATEDGGGIKIDTYEVNYSFRDQPRGPCWSSCNGLTLEYEVPRDRNKNLYRCVSNVLTGQVFRLPRHRYSSYVPRFSAIGYDAASTAYKVVVLCVYGSLDVDGCAILTVGVDKSWRILPTDHLSLCGQAALRSDPVTTDGFVHWNLWYFTKVVTLNLETEIITKSEIITETDITEVKKMKRRTCCLSTGKYLSLFVPRGRWTWEVFEMKPETGEWRKFADICLEAQHGKIKEFEHEYAVLEPFGWLKYPEVLALRLDLSFVIFYNLITCEISAEMSTTYDGVATHHKNGLEWLNGP